jgi:hypothetical protein
MGADDLVLRKSDSCEKRKKRKHNEREHGAVKNILRLNARPPARNIMQRCPSFHDVSPDPDPSWDSASLQVLNLLITVLIQVR